MEGWEEWEEWDGWDCSFGGLLRVLRVVSSVKPSDGGVNVIRRCLWVSWGLAVYLIAGVLPVNGQSPESLMEARAIGFVRVMQGGNADSLLAFMHANWVPAVEGSDREERWKGMAPMLVERHRDVTIGGVLAEQPNHLTVVTQDPNGPELRFEFDFEASPPYRITAMGVEAGRPMRGPALPELAIAPESGNDDIARSLAVWFGELARKELFSGTALVAVDGKAIFTGAWGLASREWNAANRVDTRFDLGSINKSFTRIAIGQLIAEGKLRFDDTIAKHLPDYPNAENAARITIRHLLDHSSGLGDIFVEEFFRSSKALYRSPRDFFPLFANRPLGFEPGSRSEYSNAGFMVLGAIIEAASGTAYDEYVRENIFKPAGMANSGFWAHDEIVPNVAMGYTKQGPEGELEDWRKNLFILPVKGNSAGSAQSTVEDLLAFDNALREHRLLSPEFTDWYAGGAEPSGRSLSNTRAKFPTGIAGGAPGLNAALESNGMLTVIVLANMDPPIAENVGQMVHRALRGVVGKE